MTDNTMREGKLWAFLRDSIHEAYKKLSTTGTSNEYHALLDSIASKVADDVDARFMQAVQSVAVVGEPVAWVVNTPIRNLHFSKSEEIGLGGATQEPLFRAPTHSTPAAELERLLECKVLLSESRKAMLQYGADCDEYPPFHHNKLMKRIDAALAQGKGEK